MDSSPSQWIQPLVAISIASVIAFRAHRRKSLSTSGALAGFFVMALHIFLGFRLLVFLVLFSISVHRETQKCNLFANFVYGSSRFASMLFAFFFTSSSLTKKGGEMKRTIDPEYKEGGQRNWVQVLANSGIASVLIVAVWILTEGQDKCLNSKDSPLITSLIGGVIGHYSCCNGDTWSSEIGVLSDDRPRLITTFKPVRRGTNGGVTKTGLLAAAAGGSVIGLSFVLLELSTLRCGSDEVLKQLLVVPVATLAGLGGSIIDSLLGATLQFSGFCSIRQKVVGKPGPTVKKISGLGILDNNAVNLVSILLTTILTSVACLYIF